MNKKIYHAPLTGIEPLSASSVLAASVAVLGNGGDVSTIRTGTDPIVAD